MTLAEMFREEGMEQGIEVGEAKVSNPGRFEPSFR